MRSVQNLYDRGDWIGERGQHSDSPKVFAAVFYAWPWGGLSWLGGANACDSAGGFAGVTWLYL
ncbi:hypothetical protein OAE40_00155 [Rubripirellula sp.]|nr:hypothetical protein [Rubripirellula sp.]MDB4654167.1 hypothetical protein [Rubripirellula sp.]